MLSMARSTSWLIVPAKSLTRAKTRLSSIFTPEERHDIARAMLMDVLAAARGCENLGTLAVVTGDPEVANLARAQSATVIPDPCEADTNSAVATALALAAKQDAGSVMILPADVPHVRPIDIERLFQVVDRNDVALVPASRDGGTNALVCNRPGVIVPCFGPDSFNKHIAAASRAGLQPVIYPHSALGLDLDEPCDIEAFFRLGTATQTQSFLRALDFGRRLGGSSAVAVSAAATGLSARGYLFRSLSVTESEASLSPVASRS